MRLLVVITASLALAVPALALAAARSSNDGTLSVKNATGTIVINAKGGVIGRFESGSVRITDPVDADGSGPIVTGAERHHEVGDTTDVWSGTKVRFRLIGGSFRVKVQGTGIFLSVVGRGEARLTGRGTDDDGSFSLNDAQDTPLLPDTSMFLTLAAPSP
jgi:hypothetical protein